MNNFFKSNLLKSLESVSLEEVTGAIDELKEKKGKICFGKKYDDLLDVLYTLEEIAEKKALSKEVHFLKEDLIARFEPELGIDEARSKAFNIWVEYQNQGKGLEFVKKSLIAELEELKND
ncbi:hypothetical protein ABQE17_03115 [Enterococcus gallinarum]|uniref:hypothetical protein n=1 Tax=Enterococcus gallinarum TaxID=1353 RepID=UPI0032E43583